MKHASWLVFGILLLSGCLQVEMQDSNARELTNSNPLELTLAEGDKAVLKVDRALLEIGLAALSEGEATYTLSKQGGDVVENVLVLTDGTVTNVDLDGDGQPNLELQVTSLVNNTPGLRVVKIAVVESDLAPKMCTEGFERASSAVVVFAIDTSRSMDYPTNPENTEEIPTDLLEQMEVLRDKLPQLAEATDAEEFGAYLGSGNCIDVSREHRALCEEVETAFETSRDILRDSPSLYNKYSKMSAAKKTASQVLNAVRSAQRLSKADVEVALVSFTESATIERRLTSDFSLVQEEINDLRTSPSTNIGDAMRKSFEALEEKTADHVVLVLLTDGRPSTGLTSEQIIDEYALRASGENVAIYTIGFGLIEDEVDEELLETLASQTEGSYAFAKTSEELLQAFENALGIGTLRC